MGFFEWLLLSFMIFLLIVNILEITRKDSGSKSELEEKLCGVEKENEELKRELREGKAGEVLIRFKNGKTGTFGKVDKIEEEGSFTVLRSYNGKIVAKASTSEVALITSAKLLKGDEQNAEN